MIKTVLAAAILSMSVISATDPVCTELPDSVVLEEEKREITAEEEEALLRMAMAEAGNQGVDGMRYVISAALNRVESESTDFKDSILEVIYQPCQFSTAFYGQITNECRDALELELQEQIDTEILWFCSSGWPAYGTPAFKYKGHWFSK